MTRTSEGPAGMSIDTMASEFCKEVRVIRGGRVSVAVRVCTGVWIKSAFTVGEVVA